MCYNATGDDEDRLPVVNQNAVKHTQAHGQVSLRGNVFIDSANPSVTGIDLASINPRRCVNVVGDINARQPLRVALMPVVDQKIDYRRRSTIRRQQPCWCRLIATT